MIYNISMKIGSLLENEQAAAVLSGVMPGLAKMAQSNTQALALSVEQLVRYSRVPQADAILAKLDSALQELNTPENAISPAEAKQIAFFKTLKSDETVTPHHQDAICPGEPWLDTNGKRIQAHGGAVIYENGTYYWYGENKVFTDGKNGVWTWGIKVYASKDLCNWEDKGFLIPPVIDDPNSALYPAKRVDRPHILKCPATEKYVCWIKLSGPEAAFTVWQADSLLGEYTMVENLYNPGGYKIGDFDMVCDEKTGKGYIYFDADHKAMVCMELSEDFCHAEKELVRNYPDLNPPFTREAPALFEANGKKYMLTSGMTGYVPNRSDSAVSDSWDSLFVSLGDPHVEDESSASFNSQISKIFKVEGKDNMFVAMADRWLPDTKVDARLADLFTRVIGSNYDPERYQATMDEKKEMYAANKLETADTRIADYVWLPITWNGEKPVIHWLSAWNIAD